MPIESKYKKKMRNGFQYDENFSKDLENYADPKIIKINNKINLAD